MQSSFYYFWRLIFVRKEIARIDWFVELNFMGYHLNRNTELFGRVLDG